MKNFFKYSYKYLVKQTGNLITKKELDDFITIPDNNVNNITSMSEVYRTMLIILQDYQSMPNVIDFNNNEKVIKKLLCNFNCKRIVSKYSDGEKLYKDFQQVIHINNASSKRNLWLRYSNSAISAALFLSKFKNVNEFVNFINSFNMNVYTKEALPLVLSVEIYGLGFALACNFIKELGFMDYPKPDGHMIKIFYTLGLCEDNDISCYKAMIEIAKDCHVSAYTLDKTLWLICSGNYYRYKKSISRKGNKLRDDFINYLSLNKGNL